MGATAFFVYSGQSPALLPLVARGGSLGVLALVAARGGWTADVHRLTRGIADELRVALADARRYEEARHLADRDPPTGLHNHHYLHERLATAAHRGRRIAVAR